MNQNPERVPDRNDLIAYIESMNNIIASINGGFPQVASDRFQEFIKKIKKIGSYNRLNWTEDITEKIYDLGKLIAEKYPKLIDILKEELADSIENEKEILYFIESEIIINLWDYSDPRCSDYLKNLNNKYPLNPEFLHDLGNLESSKSNYLLAINYNFQALKMNPQNRLLLRFCYMQEVIYIESLIEEEKFNDAMIYVKNCLNLGTYDRETNYKNWLSAIGSRIKDHELIRKALNNKEKHIENIMEKKFENERFKAIELIGVFIAIIAFVFSTISFTKNFSISDTILVQITFGLILILFVIALSLIFQPKEKDFYKDTRFYSIIVLVITLIAIYFGKGW